MLKLSEEKWNLEVIKHCTYEWFCKNIEVQVKAGHLIQPSKSEIKKTFEKLTGKQIKNNE